MSPRVYIQVLQMSNNHAVSSVDYRVLVVAFHFIQNGKNFMYVYIHINFTFILVLQLADDVPYEYQIHGLESIAFLLL